MRDRRTLCLGAGSLALVAVLSGAPLLLSGNGTGASLSIWVAEARRREGLVADHRRLDREREVRKEVLAELIAGRLSLREAGAALQAEHESRPPHLRPFLVIPPGQTVEEYYRRLAYGLAEDRLRGTPRRAEVLRRLRAEQRAGRLPAVE